jgi:hypothetical protein
MMESIDENGKWIIQNGVEILVEPSDEWKQKNQPEPTPAQITEERRQNILQELKQLDNPRDAEALFYVFNSKGLLTDNDLPAETLDRFNQKKALRQQLGGL